IHLVIGRRPYSAFGNSTGDRQMLEYTGAGDGARLMMLVLHDDAKREYVWVPKMPSESFRPEFHQIDEVIFDSAFVNSDNSASHSLGQTNLRKIRPSSRDGPFGLFRRI